MNDFTLTKVEKIFFNFFTILFHPLLMPSYTIASILLLYSHYIFFNPLAVKMLLTVFFLMTAVIPLIVMAFMYYFHLISSFYLPLKEERIIISATITVFYFFTFYLLRGTFIPSYIFIFIIAMPMISFALLLMQFLIPKISIHTYAIGSLLGVLVFYRFITIMVSPAYILLSAIFASGIIISARLLLKAHDTREVFSGFLTGMIISFFCMYISNGYII